MNPSKIVVLLLTLSLLPLLTGCEGMLPTESNPPAVVPNLQPGAPIPGGLQIAYAHASPQLADTGHWKSGTVNVHFNGAATTEGVVVVEALPRGGPFFTHVGEAKFVPGQTDVQVKISVSVQEPGPVPLKVRINRASAEFQTATHYRGNR